MSERHHCYQISPEFAQDRKCHRCAVDRHSVSGGWVSKAWEGWASNMVGYLLGTSGFFLDVISPAKPLSISFCGFGLDPAPAVEGVSSCATVFHRVPKHPTKTGTKTGTKKVRETIGSVRKSRVTRLSGRFIGATECCDSVMKTSFRRYAIRMQ